MCIVYSTVHLVVDSTGTVHFIVAPAIQLITYQWVIIHAVHGKLYQQLRAVLFEILEGWNVKLALAWVEWAVKNLS